MLKQFDAFGDWQSGKTKNWLDKLAFI